MVKSAACQNGSSSLPTMTVLVASLMRSPHAYMVARHVLWIGSRIPTSLCRTGSSVNASGSRFCRERRSFFPEQVTGTAEPLLVEEVDPLMTGPEGAARHPSLAQV